MNVSVKITNKQALICVNEQVNSTNAHELGEAYAQLENQEYTTLTLDVNDMEYISSAGLREILKISKKEKDNFKIINANREVYDIFELTGFTTFVHIERKLRKVFVDESACIASGQHGKVYRLDDDKIVKTIFHPTSIQELEQEKIYAKAAFVKGIPTAISFDIIECNNYPGIVYETIDAQTLASIISDDMEHLEQYVNQYVRFAKLLHYTDGSDSVYSPLKDLYKNIITNLTDLLTPEEIDSTIRLIDSIEDHNCLIHGDLHTKNFLVENGEPFLIDMFDMGYGDPIFEFMGAYIPHYFVATNTPDDNERVIGFVGLNCEKSRQFWNLMIEKYFSNQDETTLAQIKETINFMGLLNFAWKVLSQDYIPEERKKSDLQHLRRDFFPYIEEHIGKVSLYPYLEK